MSGQEDVEPATNYRTLYQDPHPVHVGRSQPVFGLRGQASPGPVIIRVPNHNGYHEISRQRTLEANPGLQPGELEAIISRLPQRVVEKNFDYSKLSQVQDSPADAEPK